MAFGPVYYLHDRNRQSLMLQAGVSEWITFADMISATFRHTLLKSTWGCNCHTL